VKRKVIIEDEQEDVHRWLLSYADFITLIFTFFVALYAMSTLEIRKAQEFALSLKQVFRVIDLPVDLYATSAQKTIIYDIKSVTQDIEGVNVRIDARGAVISLAASTLFASGSAEINPVSIPMLESIAKLIAGQPGQIIIEGHTDNVPVSRGPYKSNWELSGARASSVLHLLVAKGGDPKRYTFAGYADFKPVATNETAEGRAVNRRVEIIITKPGGHAIEIPGQRSEP
jgi:chemotaxis protein MotB